MNMSGTVTRTINVVVVVLMTLEIFGMCVITPRWTANPTIYREESPSSFLGSIVFEKAEEETEETEEGKSFSRLVLLDFSQIARSLSIFYINDYHSIPHLSDSDVKHRLHQRNCVFLI